jgi:hypothetical protein
MAAAVAVASPTEVKGEAAKAEQKLTVSIFNITKRYTISYATHHITLIYTKHYNHDIHD